MEGLVVSENNSWRQRLILRRLLPTTLAPRTYTTQVDRTRGALIDALNGKSPVWAVCTWCKTITKCAVVHHTELLGDGSELRTDGDYCVTCFLKLCKRQEDRI
jgi:hypothetical protein